MSQFNYETTKCKKQKTSDTTPEDRELIELDDKPGEVTDKPDVVHEEDIEAVEEADPGCEASNDQVIDNLDNNHPELVMSPADVKFACVVVKKVQCM